MGFVDLHRRAQRVTGPLEAGFEDVVSIFARKLYKVDGAGHALSAAVKIDEAHKDEIPSTKGLLV